MPTKLLGWGAALLVVACFAIGFGVVSKRILTDLSGEVALGWVTFIATTWFAIWSFQKTKRKEAEAQIFPEKAKIYKEIIDIIRDLTFAQKGWAPAVDEEELGKRFGRIRYDMIIWAGQDTIRALSAFEELSSGGDVGVMFAASANLYSKNSSELGHADDQIGHGPVLDATHCGGSGQGQTDAKRSKTILIASQAGLGLAAGSPASSRASRSSTAVMIFCCMPCSRSARLRAARIASASGSAIAARASRSSRL